MTQDKEPLTIISMAAANFKRIKAVRIEPSPGGGLVEITGRNGQGKTSVLDSIWLAFAGKAAAKDTPQPIREGESSAFVTVDMGDFTVTRHWSEGKDTKLTVVSKDGMTPKSPQAFLDEKLGALSFDPVAFTRKAAKDQLADLIALVDLPFDPLDLQAEKDLIFGTRTEVGRRLKELQGQLAGFGEIPDDVLDEPVSTEAILDEVQAAERVHRTNEQTVMRAHHLRDQQQDLLRQIKEIDARLLEMKPIVEEAEAAVRSMPAVPDVEVLRERMANADVINAEVRNKQDKAKVEAQVGDVAADYDELTEKLAAIDERKRSAVEAAEMPVPGLGFDDTGVTFNGIPFSQCSSAEQLRVSVAMAIAGNPKIGVAFIRDGSLLDDDSMALVTAMAEASGHQVWIERVGAGEVGFVIEDGEVA